MGERERERLERAGVLYSYYRLFAEVTYLSDTPHAKSFIMTSNQESKEYTEKGKKTREQTVISQALVGNLGSGAARSARRRGRGELVCRWPRS